MSNVSHNTLFPKREDDCCPTNIYLLKVNNRNIVTDVFNVNFEYLSHLFLVFLLLTLDMQMCSGYLTQSHASLRSLKLQNYFKYLVFPEWYIIFPNSCMACVASPFCWLWTNISIVRSYEFTTTDTWCLNRG